MKEDRIRLLRVILDKLGLSKIPGSMVQRRITIKTKFEENQNAFHDPAFVELYRAILNKGKSFSAEFLTSTSFFTFINENQDIWEDAYHYTDRSDDVLESEVERMQDEHQETIERNLYEPPPPKRTPFLNSLLRALRTTKTDVVPYPEYEKRILSHLEGVTVTEETDWIEEGLKAYANVVYGEDAITSYRVFFEDISKHTDAFNQIGLAFRRPAFIDRGEGRITRMMDAAHAGVQLSRGSFELQRLIRIANKIGSVDFSEDELIEFFSAYLNGGLDHILLNPPANYSYFREIEQLTSLDYSYDVDFSRLGIEMVCKPKELDKPATNLLNILKRVKIVEWTRNVPLGEETTLIDLLCEVQQEVLNGKADGRTKTMTVEEMFNNSSFNVVEATVDYFAHRLAYRYLLGVHKGGIERPLRNAFRNLGSPPKGLGSQIMALQKYYRAYYASYNWERQFWDDFILDLAAKGLVTAQKQTVRERVKLIVPYLPK